MRKIQKSQRRKFIVLGYKIVFQTVFLFQISKDHYTSKLIPILDHWKMVLLIYDSHRSHLTYNSIKHAMDNDVISLCFSFNSSCAFQQLYVGDFSCGIKDLVLSEQIENCHQSDLSISSEEAIWKKNRLSFKRADWKLSPKQPFHFFWRSHLKKIKATNAINRFRGTGLYSLWCYYMLTTFLQCPNLGAILH